jgi:hypothetical protein
MTHPGIEKSARALLAALALLAASARADLLVTASGESLSGDLTRVVEGVLVFKTSLEGQMMLPVSEVKSLTTEKSWVVTESGGAVHIGRFVPEGIQESAGEGGEPNLVELPMSSIASAKLVPGQSPTHTGDTRWESDAGVGVRAFEGTGDGVEPLAGLHTRRWGEKVNTSLQLQFDVTGESDSPPYFTGTFDVTGVSEASWEPFVQALVERNTNEALRVRTGLTLGVRYHFYTSESGGQLEGLAGLGANYGEWSRSFLERQALWERSDAEAQSEANALLGLRYSRTIGGGGHWSAGLSLLPSLTDADDFRAGAASTVIYPVTSRLRLRLEMLMNYDQQPAFASLDQLDTSLGASLEWNF